MQRKCWLANLNAQRLRGRGLYTTLLVHGLTPGRETLLSYPGPPGALMASRQQLERLLNSFARLCHQFPTVNRLASFTVVQQEQFNRSRKQLVQKVDCLQHRPTRSTVLARFHPGISYAPRAMV